MPELEYIKPVRIVLGQTGDLNEKWVQDRIAEDPAILGLGDLFLRDKERNQPRAGRLDLLLEDDDDHRYEVEIQLGKTNESHIIRTLEYWDIERKRYPQYEHTAVLIAEEITGRFLNVISLFNGFIPVVAIQMAALKVAGHIALVFTKVVDEQQLGPIESPPDPEPVNRAYWEERASKASLAMADEILEILRMTDSGLALKYNKFFVGLTRNGQPDHFVLFHPKKEWLRVEPRLEQSDEWDKRLEDSGLDVMEYNRRDGRYRLRLEAGDIKKHETILRDLLKATYEAAVS